MSDHGIAREEDGDAVWLVLPPRRIPRWAGVLAMGIGLVLTLFMAGWMSGPLEGLGGGAEREPWTWTDLIPLAFSLLGLPFLLVGLAVIAGGIALASGRSHLRVALGRDGIRVRECLGWLRWTWRVPHGRLRGVIVGAQRLRLRRDGAGDVPCGGGYPPAILHDLLAALRDEARSAQADLPLYGEDGPLPPPGSLAIEEEPGGACTIVLRQRRRRWPILGFALPWLGVVTAFTVAASRGGSPFLLLFSLPFWAIGIGMIVGFLHSGWRRVTLRWDGGGLELEDRSPFRRRHRRWERDQLDALVRTERGSGSSRLRVITVRSTGGDEHDLPVRLSGDAEDWVMDRLRRARAGTWTPPQRLGALPDPAGDVAAPPPAEEPAPLPAGSPIALERGPRRLAVAMPARGLRGGTRAGLVFGLVFAAFAIGFLAVGWATGAPRPFLLASGGICGLSVAVGAGVAVACLRTGTRRTAIAVEDGVVTVALRDALAARTWSVPAAAVRAVRVEDTGTRVNDVPFFRIAIAADGRDELHFGTECGRAELEAVAAHLRAVLPPR